MYKEINELYNLFRRHNHFEGTEAEKQTVIGTAAPTTKPKYIGVIYCDTINGKVYISTGTTAVSDWKLLN